MSEKRFAVDFLNLIIGMKNVKHFDLNIFPDVIKLSLSAWGEMET